MSPVIEILALGAYLPGDEERPARYVRRGSTPDVDDYTAERLIGRGLAREVEGDDASEQEVSSASTEVPLEKRPIAELRAIALELGVELPPGAKKPVIVDAIRAAQAAQATGDQGDGDLPDDLADLDDDELLELAGDWAIEPGESDRDELLAKLTAHRATLNTGENDG